MQRNKVYLFAILLLLFEHVQTDLISKEGLVEGLVDEWEGSVDECLVEEGSVDVCLVEEGSVDEGYTLVPSVDSMAHEVQGQGLGLTQFPLDWQWDYDLVKRISN